MDGHVGRTKVLNRVGAKKVNVSVCSHIVDSVLCALQPTKPMLLAIQGLGALWRQLHFFGSTHPIKLGRKLQQHDLTKLLKSHLKTRAQLPESLHVYRSDPNHRCGFLGVQDGKTSFHHPSWCQQDFLRSMGKPKHAGTPEGSRFVNMYVRFAVAIAVVCHMCSQEKLYCMHGIDCGQLDW